jgi:hypothetical protein
MEGAILFEGTAERVMVTPFDIVSHIPIFA